MGRINRKVKRAIKRRLEPVTIYRDSGENYDDQTGLTKQENYDEIETEMTITQPDPKEMMNLEEGERSKVAILIHSLEPVYTSDDQYSDIILARGEYWKVIKRGDRQLGEFWRAIATRYSDDREQPILPPVTP